MKGWHQRLLDNEPDAEIPTGVDSIGLGPATDPRARSQCAQDRHLPGAAGIAQSQHAEIAFASRTIPIAKPTTLAPRISGLKPPRDRRAGLNYLRHGLVELPLKPGAGAKFYRRIAPVLDAQGDFLSGR